MSVATECDCCKEAIPGQAYADAVCENPVCEDCAYALSAAKQLLNRHGMVKIYRGPCGDNQKEGKP